MAKQEDSTTTAIAYVVLGIVAIMAVVGLVLMFTSSKATGAVARAGYVGPDWYNRADPNAFTDVAPYRTAQLPQPAQWIDNVNTQAGASAEEQRIVTTLRQ
jgi:nitrogen fixation protein FixH